MVAAARGLRGQLIAEQADTEERATYSQAVHQALLEAGFYRMYVPRRYGGLEVDVPTFMRVGVELARGDMGAAWGACLSADHALQVGSWFPERTQDEVFGTAIPRGLGRGATLRATPEGGGYRLDGAVAYCSGIPYSTYYMGQAMLPDPDAAGCRGWRCSWRRARAFTQLDDWGDTLGLKGTGSHTIRFDGAQLPAHYVIEDVNMVDIAVEQRHARAGAARQPDVLRPGAGHLHAVPGLHAGRRRLQRAGRVPQLGAGQAHAAAPLRAAV